MLEQNSLRQKALSFAARGFPVLPLYGVTLHDDKFCCGCGDTKCRSPGKHPLSRHGKDDASTDPQTISQWFDEHPNANYGVCTDTLPTVDIDPRNGGNQAWLKLVRENYDVHTWRVQTGGGGQHIIFGATSTPVPCGKLARGVDVKGAGGYIVGVGSIHISGKRYRWWAQCRPCDVELKATPQWIRDKLAKPKLNGGPRAPEYYAKLTEPVLEGERNERLTALLGHLYGAAFPDRAVLLSLVLCFNQINVHPPLSNEEVVKSALSIARREDKKGAA
jgi:hypothetical protein